MKKKHHRRTPTRACSQNPDWRTLHNNNRDERWVMGRISISTSSKCSHNFWHRSVLKVLRCGCFQQLGACKETTTLLCEFWRVRLLITNNRIEWNGVLALSIPYFGFLTSVQKPLLNHFVLWKESMHLRIFGKSHQHNCRQRHKKLFWHYIYNFVSWLQKYICN